MGNGYKEKIIMIRKDLGTDSPKSATEELLKFLLAHKADDKLLAISLQDEMSVEDRKYIHSKAQY